MERRRLKYEPPCAWDRTFYRCWYPCSLSSLSVHPHQARHPNEPLLPLCVAVSQLQLVAPRKKKHRGYLALVGIGWLNKYAEMRDEQEAAYNMGRAHHHLGMLHLAAADYERVLRISAERMEARARLRDVAALDPAVIFEQDLAREAAHNLARICEGSGSKALARQILRALPVI